MISKIKDNLESKKGKNLHFQFNGARNQIEEFNGSIEDMAVAAEILKGKKSFEDFRITMLLLKQMIIKLNLLLIVIS